MSHEFVPSRALSFFGIAPVDPGYIYVLSAGNRLKIGRSKSKEARLRQARTWLPECEVIGVKPFWNHRDTEKYLQFGMTRFWFKDEWYEFEGDEFEEWFLAEFQSFSDTDINSDSVDFI
ncbi:GIY-YIG nuclease family protein [Ruegeria sp. HKCCD8929]|uniref:GIY-YIG nuclease family protein n=1 Tax=Ruegeria sp. HKCCD8929 TaxID=2683006 RepID=UPI001488AD2E